MVRKGGFRKAAEPAYSSFGGGYGGSSSQYSGGYAQPAKKPVQRPGVNTVSAAPAKGAFLELNQGDMVMHAAFGRGLVLSVMKMGGDALLEIAFDDIGTKKLMAKTASAHMKKL